MNKCKENEKKYLPSKEKNASFSTDIEEKSETKVANWNRNSEISKDTINSATVEYNGPNTIQLSPPSFSLSPASSLADITDLINSPKLNSDRHGNKLLGSQSSQPPAKNDKQFQPPIKKQITNTGTLFTSPMLPPVTPGNNPTNDVTKLHPPKSDNISSLRETSKDEELMINQLLSNVEGKFGQPISSVLNIGKTTSFQKGLTTPNLSNLPQQHISQNTSALERLLKPSKTCPTALISPVSALNPTPILLQSPPMTKLRAPSVADSSPEIPVSVRQKRQTTKQASQFKVSTCT